MSQIVVEMSAKELALWKAQQRIIDQGRELEGTYTRVGRSAAGAGAQAKQAGETSRSVFASATQSVGAYLTGLLTIRTAVGTLKEAYAEWNQEMQELSETSKDLMEEMVKTMTEAGDLAAAPKITVGLEAIKTGTREETRQLYAGARGGAPTEDVDRLLAVVGQAARAIPLKAGGDLEGFGTLAGQLAALMPEKKPENVADIALILQQRAGDQIDKLTAQSFRHMAEIAKQAGLSTERALAIGSVAISPQVGMRANTFLTALEKMTAPKVEIEAKAETQRQAAAKATGPEADAAFLLSRGLEQFARADLEERFRLLQTNEALGREIVGTEAMRFRAITPERVEAAYTQIRRTETEDYIGGQLELLRQAPQGPGLLRQRELEILDDIAKRGDEIEARRRDRLRAAVEPELRGKDILTQFAVHRAESTAEFLSALPGIRGRAAPEGILGGMLSGFDAWFGMKNLPDIAFFAQQAHAEESVTRTEKEHLRRVLAGKPPSLDLSEAAQPTLPPRFPEAAGVPTDVQGPASLPPLADVSRVLKPTLPTLSPETRPAPAAMAPIQAEVTLPSANQFRRGVEALEKAAGRLGQAADTLERTAQRTPYATPLNTLRPLGRGPDRPVKR